MPVSANSVHLPELGVTAPYWQYGDPAGTPIILVHGFRGDHHGLDGIAAGLVDLMPEIRAIVPDLPGFGEAAAIPGREHSLALYSEWLRAFAAAVAPAGYGLLGHSFGSLVVSTAIRDGALPSRLVLINPISAPALEGPQAALTALAVGYYRAADLLPEPAARGLLGAPVIVRVMSEVMAKTHDPALRRWIHGQHAAYFSRFADSRTLLEAFRASVSHTVIADANHFSMPTMLIAGDRDDITPLVRQLELQHRIPDAQLEILPGTGHLVHYEAVAEACAAITQFLRAHATGIGTSGPSSQLIAPAAGGGA